MRRPRRTATTITEAELDHRAKWGGIGDVPVLSPSEHTAWVLLQHARATWVPHRALRYMWSRADPVHGYGGSDFQARRRHAGDPDLGDGWRGSDFRAALAQDEGEIEAVLVQQPEQAARLRDWLSRMEQLGQLRDRESSPLSDLGAYYEVLSDLGYSTTHSAGDAQ